MYANITQTGILDGFGSFRLVLLEVLGDFGWFHVLVTTDFYGHLCDFDLFFSFNFNLPFPLRGGYC